MVLSQVFLCSSLTGLIWTIQLVHYPTFSYVEERMFTRFHDFHSQRISLLVVPLMITELATAIGLVWLNKDSFYVWNLGILALIWLSTFLLSVPKHSVLARAADPKAIRALVATNWVRTILWTARSIAWFLFLQNL